MSADIPLLNNENEERNKNKKDAARSQHHRLLPTLWRKGSCGCVASVRTIGKFHGKLSAYRGNIIIGEMLKNLFYGVIVA